MKKILFISHKYPPAIGGMEKHAYQLHTQLAERHEVIPLIYDNVEGRFNFFRKLEKRIQKILCQHPTIDLIYVNEGLLAGFVARIKRWTSIKIMATVHGLDIVFPNIFYQKFIHRRLNQLDGLIAVSDATKKACLDRGIDTPKILVVNNGVGHDLAKVPLNNQFLHDFQKKYQLDLSGKQILVTMGRAVQRKGFSWFVQQVTPKLSKDTIFLLIGPRKASENWWYRLLPTAIKKQVAVAFSIPNDELPLKEAINLPANKNRVFELGKLPFSEVAQLLKIADLFIMPNRSIVGDMEGFGLVGLEAAISGTPVVAAGIEGITNAIQSGKNGYLLPAEQSAFWVKTIKEILADKTNLEKFSQTAKAYTLQQFSWSKMVDEYETVFVEVVKKA